MKRHGVRGLCLLVLPVLVGCAVLERARSSWWELERGPSGQAPDPATTPEAVVQVYAARAVSWRGVFAVHTWIAVKPRHAASYTRYEVIGWGVDRGWPAIRVNRTGPDNYWFGDRPQKLVDLRGAGVDEVIAKIGAAVAGYPYPASYRTWPGPNSNTFTAWVGRRVPELRLRLPPTAIGKDYLPGGALALWAGWRRRRLGRGHRAELPHAQLRRRSDASGAEASRPRAPRRVLTEPGATPRAVVSSGAPMDVLELGLAGKVALVTGASEGLGRATADRFARSGAKVAMCARHKDVLERAADAIRHATGADLLAQTCDVTRPDQVEAFVAAAVARWGGVDILVNNAGTSAAAGFADVDDGQWQADFDLKVMAAIRLCRLVIPHMKRRGGGSIVNVTTVGGKAPAARALPTSVTRAAGINLTKSLANEYAADTIRVNTICLGVVKSGQWERRMKGDPEAFYREMAEKRRVPLGRFGEAHEFADLVAFLCSERAAYITGAAINFDGGLSAAV